MIPWEELGPRQFHGKGEEQEVLSVSHIFTVKLPASSSTQRSFEKALWGSRPAEASGCSSEAVAQRLSWVQPGKEVASTP